MSGADELNKIGIHEGTDKSFMGNDYLRHYFNLFKHWRDEPINVLEIGVAFGGSVRTWEKFFTRATIIGIDITPSCKQYETGRIVIEIGSQTDPDFLDRVCAKYPPTIIIDDGSHFADDQIFSFNHLFPVLPPGGCYVVEDIFFQMLPGIGHKWLGPSGLTALGLLLGIAEDRTARAIDSQSVHPTRARFFGGVDRVEFFPGAVALWTTPPEQPLDAQIELARDALAGASARYAWDMFYNYLRAKSAPFEVAAQAAAAAREVSQEHIIYHTRISELHERDGNLGAAAEELEKALAYPHTNEWGAEARGRLERLRSEAAPVIHGFPSDGT